MTELITPPGVPVAAGPYSPGLLTGDWIFLSGQGGQTAHPRRRRLGARHLTGVRSPAPDARPR
jgi:enamine deaminase RidA (YjgF/YER057c/UK114 family)